MRPSKMNKTNIRQKADNFKRICIYQQRLDTHTPNFTALGHLEVP